MQHRGMKVGASCPPASWLRVLLCSLVVKLHAQLYDCMLSMHVIVVPGCLVPCSSAASLSAPLLPMSVGVVPQGV